jgi:hypothetical protein
VSGDVAEVPRWLPIPVLVTALALALAACGGDDVADEVAGATNEVVESGESLLQQGEDLLEQATSIDLTEQNGSGITGTATVTPVSESQTEVVLDLTGGEPSDEPRPAHIHKGTCEDLDPTPAYPLESVQDGHSETTVEVSAIELLAEPFAINVHRSEADAGTYVACGEIAVG